MARPATLPPGAERERGQRELERGRDLGARGCVGRIGGRAGAYAFQGSDRLPRLLVRQWKIGGALWLRYGGRIGCQQGGPEPLDAHHALLERARSRGELVQAAPEHVTTSPR